MNCPTKMAVCYNCYTPGHKRVDCPNLIRGGGKKPVEKPEILKPQARSFQITVELAKVEPDVVAGTFMINSMPAHVLFDTGANKSFVSHEFVRHPSFVTTKLSMPLEVEVTDNTSFLVFDVCQNCKLTVENEDFDIDLIPLAMGEFKVVVGMDGLSRYHANVKCDRKVIQLTSPNGKKMAIYGEKKNNLVVCSIEKAWKIVQKGGKAYLAYMPDVQTETPRIEDVQVVREFRDVFPADLPGLPPDREVEFRIYLVPGAKPVVKSPYRLAPSKLQELMTQLQELLDKGFI
jgi:hypothetical protein